MKLFANGMIVPALIVGFGMSFFALAQDMMVEEPLPPSQPPVSAQEIKDFQNEMRNQQKEAKQLQKQLSSVKGADELKKQISEVLSETVGCLSKLASTKDSDEKREVMNDCRQMNFWQAVNDVREQFVPPSEIKNVLNDIKNQRKELDRFKKQLAKSPSPAVSSSVDSLIAQADGFRDKINASFGRDQRDAMQDYWDARFWEEINKIRSKVELPKQLKDMEKDMKAVKKLATNATLKKAFQFFGIDEASFNNNVAEREKLIASIYEALNGDEDANELMQEVWNNWGAGDLRNLLDMTRESYSRMKGLKDADVKNQIMEILSPIVDSFNEGDYRNARDAMQQFSDQMRRYEYLFRPNYTKGLDSKTSKALEKLEGLINDRFNKETGPGGAFEQGGGQFPPSATMPMPAEFNGGSFNLPPELGGPQ